MTRREAAGRVGLIVRVVAARVGVLVAGFALGAAAGQALVSGIDPLVAGACGAIALGMLCLGWGVRGLYEEHRS